MSYNMRLSLFTVLALGLWGLSGCTGPRQIAGAEYDDIYYTSADAKAEQEAREANTAATNNVSTAPASEPRAGVDNTRQTTIDRQPVAGSADSYDRRRMAKTGESEEFYYNDDNWNGYENDDFYYSRRIRRFGNRGARAGWGYYDPYFAYDPYYVINTPTWSYFRNDPWWYDPFYYQGPSYSWTYGWGRPGYSFYPGQFNSWGNCFGCNSFNAGWGNPGWGNSWNFYSVSYGTTGYYYSSGWSSYYGGGFGGYYSQTFFNGGAGYNPCAYGAGYQGWAFGRSNSNTTYAPRPTTSSIRNNPIRPPRTAKAQAASIPSEQNVRLYQTANPQAATGSWSLPASTTARPGRPAGSNVTDNYNSKPTTGNSVNTRDNTVGSQPVRSNTIQPNNTYNNSSNINTTQPNTNPSYNTGNPRNDNTISNPPNNTLTPRATPNNTSTPRAAPNNTLTPRATPNNTLTPRTAPNNTLTPRTTPNNTVSPNSGLNYNRPEGTTNPSRNYNSAPSRRPTRSNNYSIPSGKSSGSVRSSINSRSTSSPSRQTGGVRRR